MAKDKVTYICGECGYETAKWMWRCPACDSWNTLVETQSVKGKPTGGPNAPAQSQLLSSIIELPQKRVSTEIGEFDRALGGGLIRGMVVLLGGDPGIGKSTLLLQAADHLAGNATVLYVSSPET